MFEWKRQTEKIQGLWENGQREEARRGLVSQYVQSLVQETSSRLSGNDPYYDKGATIALAPEVQAMRNQRLLGEKLGKLDRAVQENKPEVDWLNGLAQQYSDQFHAQNKLTLAQIRAMTPEQQNQMLQPVKLLESQAGNIQQRIAKLNARFKQIDPNFSVFSHPITAEAAHNLGIMANGERPSIFQKQADPYMGMWGNALTVGYKAVEGVTEVGAGLVRPIGAAGGLFGDWVLRSLLSEDSYNAALEWSRDNFGFHPDNVGVANVEVRDPKTGQIRYVKNRFGLPEMMAPFAAMMGKRAMEFSADAREAEDVWDAYGHQGAWGWGIAGDIAHAAGSWAAFGPATKPFTAAMMGGKNAIAAGMALVGARATPTAARIANFLAGGVAEGAAMGAYETLSNGFMEGYADSWKRGMETGLVMWAVGGLGRQAEQLLMRNKMPAFLSQQMGSVLEGIGFTGYAFGREMFTDSPLSRALWAFVQNSENDTYHDYKREFLVNAGAMMAYKALFGRNARAENVLEVARQKFEAKTRADEKAQKVAVDEAAKHRAGEATAEMLTDLKEGRQDIVEAGTARLLARYAHEVEPYAREMGAAGRAEARIGSRQGELPETKPGSLSGLAPIEGPTGTFRMAATENLADRLMRFNRRQDANEAEGGQSFMPGEVGLMGVHLGGKMLFNANRGNRRTQEGPANVSMVESYGRLVEQLVAQGHTREEAMRAVRDSGFSLHNHPGGDSLSGADMRAFGREDSRRHFVVTSRGIFVSSATEAKPSPAKGEKIQREAFSAMQDGLVELAKQHGVSTYEAQVAWHNWSRLRPQARELRDLGKKVSDLYAASAREVGAKHGLDIRWFEGADASRRWKAFQDGGDFEAAFGMKNPPAREGAAPKDGGLGVTETPQEKLGIPTDDLGGTPLSPERQQQLARRYKEWRDNGGMEKFQAFFREAERQVPGTEKLERTPENAERIMDAVGVETGAGAPPSGPAQRRGFGAVGASDAESAALGRRMADLEAKAQEAERDAEFSKRVNQPFREAYERRTAAAMREEAERLARGEGQTLVPDVPTSSREPTELERAMEEMRRAAEEEGEREPLTELNEPDRLEAPRKPKVVRAPKQKQAQTTSPSSEDARKIIESMVGIRGDLLKDQVGGIAQAKAAVGRAMKAFTDFFRDPDLREALAKRIEHAGYRSKFRGLGPDEEFMVGMTDRLRHEFRSSKDKTSKDLEYVFESIRTKDIDPKQRLAELIDVQRYAFLKDHWENRIRSYMETERTDKGDIILDDKGKPKLKRVTRENILPGNIKPEDWKAAMEAAEEILTPEGREAYKRMRETLDEAWQSQVERGIARPEDKQKFYFPRKVVDWENYAIGIGPLVQTLPKEPFRGWLKARRGSERLVNASLDTLFGYLQKVRLTNAVHDYNETTAMGVETRILGQLGVSRDELANMKPDEWEAFRQQAEKEQGAIVVDTRRGATGRQTVERDPVGLDLVAKIQRETNYRVIPEAVVGRNLRPDAEAGRFLVSKPLVEFWRMQRERSSWLTNPILNGMRRMVGKWFKGPALRGILGVRVPGRNARNVVSDLTGIAFKDSLQAAAETSKLIPQASPMARAIAARDQEAALAKLTPEQQSLAREFLEQDTGSSGQFLSGQDNMRDSVAGQWIKAFVPDTSNVLKQISKLVRGDSKWAAALDNYGENIVRLAYFMRERASALRDQIESAHGQTPEQAATLKAHLQVSDVLINYNWLTPFERVALNGLLFPFYTWTRYNFTKTIAETLRHPGNTAAKWLTYSGIIGAFNWMIASDEENRLTQLRPDLAGKGHLIMPWIRDEFGNPMILSFEDTFTAAGDFLGLSGAPNKVLGAIMHGNPELLMRDLVGGGIEQSQRAIANVTAPWIRKVLDVGYRSSYETVGERAEHMADTAAAGFLPAKDVQRILGETKRDEGVGMLGRAGLIAMPSIRFLDLSRAVPLSQASGQFEAGRLQRVSGQVSAGVGREVERFTAGLRQGNSAMMQQAVDRIWSDLGPSMSEAGMSEANLWSRLLHAAKTELRQQMVVGGNGSLPPKFFELSRTQQAQLLVNMGR